MHSSQKIHAQALKISPTPIICISSGRSLTLELIKLPLPFHHMHTQESLFILEEKKKETPALEASFYVRFSNSFEMKGFWAQE